MCVAGWFGVDSQGRRADILAENRVFGEQLVPKITGERRAAEKQ